MKKKLLTKPCSRLPVFSFIGLNFVAKAVIIFLLCANILDAASPSRGPTLAPSRFPTVVPSRAPSRLPTSQPSAQPSRQPTTQPSKQPYSKPTSQPTRQPTMQPTVQPSSQPSSQPTLQPASFPSTQPSSQPTIQPTSPTGQPTSNPTQPTSQPTRQPSRQPTGQPVSRPTSQPSSQPSHCPSRQPSSQPSAQPISRPSAEPSAQPVSRPSSQPSSQPSMNPTAPSSVPTSQPTSPTGQPTRQPSSQPTGQPSAQPSAQPFSKPSSRPTRQPTSQPTCQPASRPTSQPSRQPSTQPSKQPYSRPTSQPSNEPTSLPSVCPSVCPTGQPSSFPSNQPSSIPSTEPSQQPSSQPSAQPSQMPSSSPSTQPSSGPSTQPSRRPSSQPSSQPSMQPASRPSSQPSSRPSVQPSRQPTSQPSQQPFGKPSSQPTGQPSTQPTAHPSGQPSRLPSSQPSQQPSSQPSHQPSTQPSSSPTKNPSSQPSSQPTMQPTSEPSVIPTQQPSSQPSSTPTTEPSQQPVSHPTSQPSREPSSRPSSQPSSQPTQQPTSEPSQQPLSKPSGQPTAQPSVKPTSGPSSQPSNQPSTQPSAIPSSQPSDTPTSPPSSLPTLQPTLQPTRQPSGQPSIEPSASPSTQPSSSPSAAPSNQPSQQPFSSPSSQPSKQPSAQPTTSPSASPSTQPTSQPTSFPTAQPSQSPSSQPSVSPSSQPSSAPSAFPSTQPSAFPSSEPSTQPTNLPSTQPSCAPTASPSSLPSAVPSSVPSTTPTTQPSSQPSSTPSGEPSTQPSSTPSSSPTSQPSGAPSASPSTQPSGTPTALPSAQPTDQPSCSPSSEPSSQPSNLPSSSPTSQPSAVPSASPSTQPSGTPTALPSAQPTDQPSSSPSSEPSTVPTSQPSAIPSTPPSTQPSATPTTQPFSAPSRQPAARPSSQPTSRPSEQPSSWPSQQPSSQPTQLPSTQPSKQPRGCPTSQPTRDPTTQPSRQPSVQPTSQPSTQPKSKPSSQPSSQPVSRPTGQPTSQPSRQPTRQPTTQPSRQPVADPTAEPTRVSVNTRAPIHFPTSMPTITQETQWTEILASVLVETAANDTADVVHRSTYYELDVMTNAAYHVYGSCSSWSAWINGDLTTSSYLYKPTVLTLTTVSALRSEVSDSVSCADSEKIYSIYSILTSAGAGVNVSANVTCAEHLWAIRSCSGARMPPSLCVDCENPCDNTLHCQTTDVDGLLVNPYSFSPCQQPLCNAVDNLERSSSLRVMSLAYVSFKSIPKIQSIQYASSKSSITVTSRLSISGLMYCAAYLVDPLTLRYTVPSSASQILLQNHMAPSANNISAVTITGLKAASVYQVYCLTVSSIGETMPLQSILSSGRNVSTLCCKTAAVTLSAVNFLANTSMTNLIALSLSDYPRATMTISLSLINTTNGATISNAATPASFTVKSVSSAASTLYASTKALAAGQYTLKVTLSEASSDFAVSFSNGNAIRVLQPSEPPPAPIFTSATFADDGSYLLLKFASATNKGGYSSGSFACALMFQFDCAVMSLCSWRDSTSVIAYVSNGDTCAAPGDTVSLASTAVVKAACQQTGCDTASWPATPQTQLIISASSTAAAPTISISMPNVIGGCDSLTIDLTGSTGSGGRSWLNRTIDVYSLGTADVSRIQSFLNSPSYQLSPPTAIPGALFSTDMSYNFVVNLCNFLRKCSQSSSRMTVLSTILPFVSLPGFTLRTTKRSASLVVSSVSYIADCDGTMRYNDMAYQWVVQQGGVEQRNLVSTSKDGTKFAFAPYSLTVDTLYNLYLTVTIISTQQSSTAGITVFVEAGEVVASIARGSAQSMRVGEPFVLDASASYDEDIALLTGESAGLLFSWSCAPESAAVSADCNALFNFNNTYGLTSQYLRMVADVSATNLVVQFTVTVSSGERNAEASVTVTVQPEMAPLAGIVLSGSQTSTKVNAAQTLKLTGSYSIPIGMSADVTWTVNADSGYSLASNALSTTAYNLPVQSATAATTGTLYLALKPNSLPIGASLTFTLTCQIPFENRKAVASLLLTVNTPPLPGIFSVTPQVGVELNTSFTFIAAQWIDTELPLTYQFGYLSNAASNVILQAASELTYGQSQLPAGLATAANLVTTTVSIYDSLGANASKTFDVTVTKRTAAFTITELQQFVDSSSSAGGSNANRIKQSIALSSYVLNTVDCSAAPNCTLLNRKSCYRTINTCGECISSVYLGDSGDANTACVSLLSSGSSDDDDDSAADDDDDVPLSDDAECRSNKDCDTFYECNNQKCILPNKECVSGCSGHGVCLFVNVDNGLPVSECVFGSTRCNAVCECEEDYRGSSTCSITTAELLIKQAARDTVLQNINSLISVEDPSTQSIAGWITSLTEVTQAADEISSSSASLILDTVSNILSYSQEAEVSAATLDEILYSINSVAYAGIELTRRRHRLLSSSSASTTHQQRVLSETAATTTVFVSNALQDYAAAIASTMVPGQFPDSKVMDQFRISVRSVDSTAATVIALPQSSLELFNKQLASSVTYSPASALAASGAGVYAYALRSQLYSSDGSYTANPLTLASSSPLCDDADSNFNSNEESCSVTLTLQYSDEVVPVNITAEYHSATCSDGDYSVHNHTCANGLISYAACNGTAATVTTRCPVIHEIPSCNSLLGVSLADTNPCTTLSASNYNITCRCSLAALSSAAATARRLTNSTTASSGSSTVSISVTSLLTSVQESFLSTVVSAEALNIDVVEKSYHVLVTIGGFIFLVLCAMTMSHYSDQNDKMIKQEKGESGGSSGVSTSALKFLNSSANKLSKSIVSSAVTTNSSSSKNRKSRQRRQSKREVSRSFELALIEQSLPKILSSMSFTSKCVDEIKHHHRWFGVIFYYSDQFPRILRITSLATNIVVMLFMQSLTYNLVNPDDGSCNDYTSETACLGPRSAFQTGESKCYWTTDSDTGSGVCAFVQPDSSIKVVLFVAVFSAVLSTPIALLVDWIIRNYLSAPVIEHSDDNNPAAGGDGSGRAQSSFFNLLAGSSTLSLRPRRRVAAGATSYERLNKLSMTGALTDINSMTTELLAYREQLTDAQRREFDTLWGLTSSGEYEIRDGTSGFSILPWYRRTVNVKQAILNDLKSIRNSVEKEIDAFEEFEASDRDKGRRLLYLFQCDLLPGISGQILEAKGLRDFTKITRIHRTTKIYAWLSVILLNCGMLFYIFLFALQEGFHRQKSWFYSFVLWFIVEVLFVSTAIVIITHIWIPSLIMKDITKIKAKLLDNIREYNTKMRKKQQNNTVKNGAGVAEPGAEEIEPQDEGETVKTFNAAKYLFISTRVCRHYPALKESKIIESFSTPWPRQSYQHTVDVSKTYSKKFSALTRSASLIIVFFLGNMLQLPPGLQDLVLQLITTTSVGYTMLLHIQLFNIFPILAFGPVILLVVMVHFWIQAGKAAKQQELARLMPNEKSKIPVADESVVAVNGAVQQQSAFAADGAGAVASGGVHMTRRQSVQHGVQVLRHLAEQVAVGASNSSSSSSSSSSGPISSSDGGGEGSSREDDQQSLDESLARKLALSMDASESEHLAVHPVTMPHAFFPKQRVHLGSLDSNFSEISEISLPTGATSGGLQIECKEEPNPSAPSEDGHFHYGASPLHMRTKHSRGRIVVLHSSQQSQQQQELSDVEEEDAKSTDGDAAGGASADEEEEESSFNSSSDTSPQDTPSSSHPTASAPSPSLPSLENGKRGDIRMEGAMCGPAAAAGVMEEEQRFRNKRHGHMDSRPTAIRAPPVAPPMRMTAASVPSPARISSTVLSEINISLLAQQSSPARQQQPSSGGLRASSPIRTISPSPPVTDLLLTQRNKQLIISDEDDDAIPSSVFSISDGDGDGEDSDARPKASGGVSPDTPSPSSHHTSASFSHDEA